ncbi:pilin N-terminal domain-containing protein [Corynebacterium accolens]|uniref:pilin N-terminal domain-containing protein n=1 Tax=Corynebacterium accolens TaxID=38284 RepID=UPI002550A7CD|nr:hypothetical protein [Corynebacterium accolens]MDK8469791.1 hypothetical protein [Corynebacterium accolens]MDK8592803.1 hypothetical protein [Corynebacterium accolens]
MTLTAPAAPADAKVISGYATASTQVDPSSIGQELNSLTISLPTGNPFDEVKESELPPGALSGYTFELAQIAGLDIRTRQGYTDALNLTPQKARDLGFTDVKRKETSDDSGKVRFENLPAGAYLIEITPPQRSGEKHKDIQPMIVVLPATDKEGNWLHDLKVVAKTDDGGGDVPPPTDIPDPRPTPTPTPSKPNPTPPPEDTKPPGPGSDGSETTETTPADTPPAGPEKPKPSQLARTGASVLGILVLAAGLIAAGMLLIRRNNKGDQ